MKNKLSESIILKLKEAIEDEEILNKSLTVKDMVIEDTGGDVTVAWGSYKEEPLYFSIGCDSIYVYDADERLVKDKEDYVWEDFAEEHKVAMWFGAEGEEPRLYIDTIKQVYKKEIKEHKNKDIIDSLDLFYFNQNILKNGKELKEYVEDNRGGEEDDLPYNERVYKRVKKVEVGGICEHIVTGKQYYYWGKTTNGYIYKDYKAFESGLNTEDICYIPEYGFDGNEILDFDNKYSGDESRFLPVEEAKKQLGKKCYRYIDFYNLANEYVENRVKPYLGEERNYNKLIKYFTEDSFHFVDWQSPDCYYYEIADEMEDEDLNEIINDGLEELQEEEELHEDVAIDNDPDLNREQVNADVDYWTDIDEANIEDVSNAEPIGVYTVSNNMSILVYQIEYDIQDRLLVGDSSNRDKAHWTDLLYDDLDGTGEMVPYFYYGDIRVPMNEVLREEANFKEESNLTESQKEVMIYRYEDPKETIDEDVDAFTLVDKDGKWYYDGVGNNPQFEDKKYALKWSEDEIEYTDYLEEKEEKENKLEESSSFTHTVVINYGPEDISEIDIVVDNYEEVKDKVTKEELDKSIEDDNVDIMNNDLSGEEYIVDIPVYEENGDIKGWIENINHVNGNTYKGTYVEATKLQEAVKAMRNGKERRD